MTTYICLHCNYKEYKQDVKDVKSLTTSGGTTATATSSTGGSSSASGGNSSAPNAAATGQHGNSASANTITPCSISSSDTCLASCSSSTSDIYQIDQGEVSQEEKQLQMHMQEHHQIDFQQILTQHQQLKQQSASAEDAANGGVVVIESTPMNDMYLSVHIKQFKYIDDDLLRRDDFRSDMTYSCPICTGDVSVHNPAHLNPNLTSAGQQASASSSAAGSSSPGGNLYAQYENVTFDYLMNHFMQMHQFKAVPLFVCAYCNCARVSLIDCVYHYIRHHFNKKIVIGMCAFNVYDRVQMQLNQLSLGSTPSQTPQTGKLKIFILLFLSKQVLKLRKSDKKLNLILVFFFAFKPPYLKI
jgi:hypothetical protein